MILPQPYPSYPDVITKRRIHFNRPCKLSNSLSTCLSSTSVLTPTSPLPTLPFLPLVIAVDLRTLLTLDALCCQATFCFSSIFMRRPTRKAVPVRRLLRNTLPTLMVQARRKEARARRFSTFKCNLFLTFGL